MRKLTGPICLFHSEYGGRLHLAAAFIFSERSDWQNEAISDLAPVSLG